MIRLHCFAEAVLEYHHKAADTLEGLKSSIQGLIDQASSAPPRQRKPKPVTVSTSRYSITSQPAHHYLNLQYDILHTHPQTTS